MYWVMWRGVLCGLAAVEGLSSGFRVWSQGKLTRTADDHRPCLPYLKTQGTDGKAMCGVQCKGMQLESCLMMNKLWDMSV